MRALVTVFPSLLPAMLVAVLGRGEPPAAQDESILTLDQAMSMALSANRTLMAGRLGRDVAGAGVDIARQRPNPELTIESARETPHEAYTLAFPLEIGWQRKRRIELSTAAVGSAEAEIAQLTTEIRTAVRRAFYALAAAQRRTEELAEVVGLAERTRDAAQGRFDSGAAPRLELLEAGLNLDQSRADLGEAEARMESARIDLNTLLARPPTQPTSAAGDLGAGELPATDQALDLAMSASTELAVLDHRIAEAQARIELARAERVPDLVLQGTLTRRSEPEFDTGWRAGLSIDLPVMSRHQAEVTLEERTLAQVQAEREAVVAQIRGAIQAALALASAQRDRYVAYHDRILPQAAEVERMAADSYQSGQTGLVMMLQTFASVRDVRLKSVEVGLEYQNALADLERAIGAPIP